MTTTDSQLVESIVRMRARVFELRATDDPIAHEAADIIEARAEKAAAGLLTHADQPGRTSEMAGGQP